MKRIAVLLVVLLTGLSLYGCGAKDTSSNDSSSTSNPGGGSQSGSNPTFTLNLVDNGARFVSGGTGATWTPTDVRVVIRSFATVTTDQTTCQYDDSDNIIPGSCVTVQVANYTEVYKDIQDVPYVLPITVGIPAGSGYTLDVITSVFTASSGTHSILKYGQATNVNVPGTGSATVLMNSVFNILNMTITDPAVSKGKFVVTLNNALPFDPRYKLTLTFNGITDLNTNLTPTTMIVSSATNANIFTAPASFSTGGTIALQGQFTLNKSFLMSTDTVAKWTRLFPDATYGEQVYTNLTPLIAVTIPGI